MTPREFAALRQVWEEDFERHHGLVATILATLHNAHFQTDGVPWIPADFMASGSREKRRRQSALDKMETQRIMAETSGPVSEDRLPDWVRELARNRKVN